MRHQPRKTVVTGARPSSLNDRTTVAGHRRDQGGGESMKSTSLTPETDALAGEWIACECVPVSHSRKLERERDEAEQKLKTMRGGMARLCRAVSRRMMPDDPTPEDRLELRKAFDAAFSILNNDQV